MTTAEYVAELRKNLAHGDATGHTHRPALKSLLESFSAGVTATNEPKRIACGAPDFIITRKGVPLGHIETKDVGTPLDEIERGKGPHGEQFRRYLAGLPNWILTDYLEFRWHVAGERRLCKRLATFDGKKKIQLLPTAAKGIRAYSRGIRRNVGDSTDNAFEIRAGANSANTGVSRAPAECLA